jgi:hypothetical protein
MIGLQFVVGLTCNGLTKRWGLMPLLFVVSGFDKTVSSAMGLLIRGLFVIKRVGLLRSTVYSAGYPVNKLLV